MTRRPCAGRPRTRWNDTGYSVVLAENGQQALELFRQSPLAIAIVVLDLTMPVLSGEDTLRELRKIRPNLPVILSSGFNEIEAIRRFQGKGLDGFIQNPTRPQPSPGVLRRLFHRSLASAPQISES